jgi:hypothetical protein
MLRRVNTIRGALVRSQSPQRWSVACEDSFRFRPIGLRSTRGPIIPRIAGLGRGSEVGQALLSLGGEFSDEKLEG